MCIKNKLFHVLFVFALAFGAIACSSPESTAEKALDLIGKGTFMKKDWEKTLEMESTEKDLITVYHDDIFSAAMKDSDEADYVQKNGVYKKREISSYFDFPDMLFQKYQLIDKQESTTVLLKYVDYTKYPSDVAETMKDLDEKIKVDYQKVGDGAVYNNGEVPLYILRYNIESTYISTIYVVKIPEEGYRVCSFSTITPES